MATATTRTGVVLLAAGRGARFGGDKLGVVLGDRLLAHHAAAALGGISFADAVAVVATTDLGLTRFGLRIVRAPAGAPLSASIACGVAALRACNRVLIALADMPFVPEVHFRALLDRHEGPVTASVCGGVRSVPAVFSSEVFAALLSLTGDRGAAALLQDASAVTAEPLWMRDIDTADDLERARTMLADRNPPRT